MIHLHMGGSHSILLLDCLIRTKLVFLLLLNCNSQCQADRMFIVFHKRLSVVSIVLMNISIPTLKTK